VSGRRRNQSPTVTSIGLPTVNGGIVLNVSEGGLGFQALGPIEPGGPIPFWFLTNSTRVEGTGELVWTDEAQTVAYALLRCPRVSANRSETGRMSQIDDLAARLEETVI
jgi:hypothetical protein